MAGIGHFPFLEAPSRTAESIRAFLAPFARRMTKGSGCSSPPASTSARAPTRRSGRPASGIAYLPVPESRAAPQPRRRCCSVSQRRRHRGSIPPRSHAPFWPTRRARARDTRGDTSQGRCRSKLCLAHDIRRLTSVRTASARGKRPPCFLVGIEAACHARVLASVRHSTVFEVMGKNAVAGTKFALEPTREGRMLKCAFPRPGRARLDRKLGNQGSWSWEREGDSGCEEQEWSAC